MPRATTLILLLQLFLTGPAVGQDADRGPSPGTALGLSLTGTLAPVAVGAIMWAAADGSRETDRGGPALVIAGGLILGPALGYFYGGRTGHAVGWTAIRTGLVLASFAPAFAICGWGCSRREFAYDAAWLVVATGTGLAAAAAAYDIVRLEPSLTSEHSASVSLVPTYGRGPGLALQVAF